MVLDSGSVIFLDTVVFLLIEQFTMYLLGYVFLKLIVLEKNVSQIFKSWNFLAESWAIFNTDRNMAFLGGLWFTTIDLGIGVNLCVLKRMCSLGIIIRWHNDYLVILYSFSLIHPGTAHKFKPHFVTLSLILWVTQIFNKFV